MTVDKQWQGAKKRWIIGIHNYSKTGTPECNYMDITDRIEQGDQNGAVLRHVV